MVQREKAKGNLRPCLGFVFFNSFSFLGVIGMSSDNKAYKKKNILKTEPNLFAFFVFIANCGEIYCLRIFKYNACTSALNITGDEKWYMNV